MYKIGDLVEVYLLKSGGEGEFIFYEDLGQEQKKKSHRTAFFPIIGIHKSLSTTRTQYLLNIKGGDTGSYFIYPEDQNWKKFNPRMPNKFYGYWVYESDIKSVIRKTCDRCVKWESNVKG